jgi:hypothetical protein
MRSALVSLLLAGSFTAWAQGYTIATIAGGIAVPTPVPAVQASLGSPLAVAVAPDGQLAVSAGNAVYRIDSAGVMTRVAGTGIAAYSGDGGWAADAQLNVPRGLAFDAPGNLYIAEFLNQVVRRVTPVGIITTVAGIPCEYAAIGEGCGYLEGGEDLPATSVRLDEPYGIAMDPAGNLFIVEGGRLRKVDGSGRIYCAGSGRGGRSILSCGLVYRARARGRLRHKVCAQRAIVRGGNSFRWIGKYSDCGHRQRARAPGAHGWGDRNDCGQWHQRLFG